MGVISAFASVALAITGSAPHVQGGGALDCRDANLFVVAGTIAENHHQELAKVLRNTRLAGVYTSGTPATGRAAHHLSDEFGLSLVPYDRDVDGRPITRRLIDEVVAPHRDKVLLIVLDADLVVPLLQTVAGDFTLAVKPSEERDTYFAVSYANGRATVDRCQASQGR